ncbi:MAG: helix-turn-helix transcriptional regulator [Clostridiales bacterium]|jgi:transcriptional regulator with XRE-family HTH domain|nr:helix-turn-helix transcriptional regulator [Clostridiales bacterium]
MAYVKAGELIRLLRLQKKISQEKLAEGIMDRTSLSRFELGKQNITKDKMDALLNKLGYLTHQYFNYTINDDEFNAYILRDRLDELIKHNETEEADKLIAEMEKIPAFDEGRHRQYLLSCKAGNIINKKGDLDAAKALLDEAINISLPGFNENAIATYLLVSEDINIITSIATIYHFKQQNKQAISILQKLANRIKSQYIDEKDKASSLALIHYNLSKFLGLEGRYSESLEICDEAIDMCVKYSAYYFLPELVYNKAYDLFHLNMRVECEHLLNLTYYGCVLMGKTVQQEYIYNSARDNFSMELKNITVTLNTEHQPANHITA